MSKEALGISKSDFDSSPKEVFYKVSKEDFERDEEYIHRIWKRNHLYLLRQLEEIPLPFLGFHGTPKDRSASISQDENSYLEIATFYEMPATKEELLYMLYPIAEYSAAYATPGVRNITVPGVVLCFNLNDKEGRNITMSWEELKNTNPVTLMYTSPDNEEEAASMEKARKGKSGYRSDMHFGSQNRERLLCSINLPDHFFGGNLDFNRAILRKRLLIQHIINTVFLSIKSHD